jgi:ferrous iron transport protein A
MENEIYTVADLKLHENGIIQRVEGEGVLRDRLLDMGLTPGTKVYYRKEAPLGDPIEIGLRGYVLTIRKDDARKILLEEDR